MDVRTLMRQATEFFATSPAVVTETETLTFEQAWTRGIKLANGLRELGVKPGDRVAGLEDNTVDAADLFLACAIAGAVRVPLYARNARDAHCHMVADTEASVLLVDESLQESTAGLDDEITGLQHLVVRDAAYRGWHDAQSDVDPDPVIDDNDWFIIRHSGGTTGKPKGVAYSHHDWLVCGRNWFYPVPRLTPNSAIGHAGPISHASGYMFLPGWLHGGCNVLFGAFDAQRILAMMREHRVTHMFAAPSMLQALSRHPDARSHDWTDLQALIVGSAPITNATARAAREVFGETLYQLYGQTEALPLSAMSPQEWFGDIDGSEPMRSAGRVLPFAQVEIWDEDGRRLPYGEEGEIVARVEAQMHGYWRDEELTRQRLVGGWVRTGDIGRVDRNGFLYVCDRAEDLIISGGYNIWPAELETVIADHAAVIEVAVFGVPDQRWGETPLARCYVEPDAIIDEKEIVEMCAQRLGSYKRPGRVEFVHEPLPRSAVGKLQRKIMREPYWQGHERRIAGV